MGSIAGESREAREMNVLEEEIGTYEKHKEELIEKANNKFVLIKHSEIIEIFESQSDALKEGYKRFRKEPFLVKQILPVEVPLQFTSNLLGC